MKFDTQTWKRRKILVGLVGATVFLSVARLGLAQEDEVSASGRFLYQQHCATCHGPQGKGNGRMVDVLTITPADLTQLSKKNDNQFPFWRVYKVIDGREEVMAHGTRNMPVWGAWFQVAEGSNLIATGRILELVYYLKSIQEK